MRNQIEPRDRIYVKGYGFLSFAKNVGKNLGNKYGCNGCNKNCNKNCFKNSS